MLVELVKAGTTEPRERVLLDRQYGRLLHAYRGFVRVSRSDETLQAMMPLFLRRDINGIMRVLQHNIAASIGHRWERAFAEVRGNTKHEIKQRVGKASRPTVASSFQPGDREAAELMERNKLQFLQDLTIEQRQATRDALARGIRAGWGTERLARAVADSIGLTPKQQQDLQRQEATWRRSAPNGLDRAAGMTDDDFLSPQQIDRLVSDRADDYRAARAERIARTEALRVTGTAQDLALRESLRDTGIEEGAVLKEWVAANDGRTREAHAARDGVTIPLNEEFAPGIMKPGDGPAKESVNCRCTLRYHFED
jgi:hypothetical protein